MNRDKLTAKDHLVKPSVKKPLPFKGNEKVWAARAKKLNERMAAERLKKKANKGKEGAKKAAESLKSKGGGGYA